MSSLAVRASSVKNNDDLKKSSEIRYTVLNLPSTKVFVVEPSDPAANQALQGFKNEYSVAKGVDQQLSAVNKLIARFTTINPWILDENVLSVNILCQILTDLYFNAPPKHPVRGILAKALHKEAARNGDLIIKSMENTIIESNSVIDEMLKHNKFDAGKVRFFISSLIGSFDNFPEAIAAIKSCFQLLLNSFRQFIDIFVKMLQNKDDLSPARRSEVFIDLHHAIRAVLAGVQQFNHDSITDASLLEPILSQCWIELLDNPLYADSPVDTKINCALLKVNYDRSFGDIFAPRHDILNQFAVTESTTAVLPKDIYYAIAIINTTIEKDFTDANFFPAFKVIVNRLISVGNEYTMDSCLIMAVTRALVQCTKKLLYLLRKASLQRADDESYLREAVNECLAFVWINVHHSVDCVRYLSKDLLKNLLRLGQEQPEIFGEVVNEIIGMAKSNSTSETLLCFLLDYLCQVFTTEYVLSEIPNIQQKILSNLFNDSCWAACYEQLMLKNSEINLEKWCSRWIQPLMQVDDREWKNDFDHLKIIRNLFERALKTRPEAAEYILADTKISIEIYLFVLWIMRRGGRKIYAPENFIASSDSKVIYAKLHPSDEIRILAFRILIECHKVSSAFPVEDLNEILDFFRFNCNVQNPAMRQQINTTVKRAMARLECGYSTAKRTPTEESAQLCSTYETFLRDLIAFCVDWCLFDGANFGRRTTGLTTLRYSIETWQKILPENKSIYTEKLWVQMQKTLSDSYVNNKDVASDILLLCWKFYPEKTNILYSLEELKKLVKTFRPYEVATAAHYLVFSAFSGIYFKDYYDAVLWCETILDDGLAMAKKSLLCTARYNAMYGLVLSIRQLLKRIDFSNISDATGWQSFFQRMIPKCKELTDVVAPVVNSSAPEGHLPNDLNDVSHYLAVPNDENVGGSQIKVTAQMILLCAWRTVRETALLLGEIALHMPVLTSSNPNGIVSVEQLLHISGHFQQLLVETKHRGAFEQSFLGFSNLCLRLWRSHEPQLHSYPTQLVEKIAKIISGGESTDNESNAVIDVKKLCATRRSAGVPFMVQGIATTESQVCSSSALNFCMTTFMNIAKTGPVEESRTHSLNILRALFKCTELGEAVSEYISDGIECSIRGYSAVSWPERNSSTLLFSALMVRVFGVPRSKMSENMSIKNKMTGRLFFIRYPRLYDFFYVELMSASKAIERNERPPRLHPLLLLISRLYPSAHEGTQSNLRLSSYVPFISTCSSSPELATRQLSAKSIVVLIPLANIAERVFFILEEISVQTIQTSLNTIHGYLLQVLYLLRSTKQENYEIDVQILKEFASKFVTLKLPVNNIIGKTYLEILLEILMTDRFHPIDLEVTNQLIEVRDKFVKNFAECNQYGQLTQSYIQKSFTIFNLLLSANVENEVSAISFKVFNTQNELIETQLNIKYLFLCQSVQNIIANNNFSHYEIELIKFFTRNHMDRKIITQFLPATRDLYYIIDHKREFYPFGVIRAFEILSFLIASPDAFEKNSDLKRLSIGKLMEMVTAIDEVGVDDVEESMWKFITAHLYHCQLNPSQVTTEQIKDIIKHLRNSTQSYKSPSLRQTVTEALSIIIQYFRQCTNLDLIIDFAELLLNLLRDDDLYVRNRTAEIVMDFLIQDYESKHSVEKVIPLAAEDHLLQWVDLKFIRIAENSWSKWLDLLRLVFAPLATKKQEENVDANDSDDSTILIDVDIFDDTDPNTFDETIYTSYKCYKFMVKHINNAKLNSAKKQEILSEFAILQNI